VSSVFAPLSKAFKAYQSLTKFGIVLFVLVVGLCGYALGLPAGSGVDFSEVMVFVFGLYALSSGSLALNQVQEIHLDKKMKRTQSRPLVCGFFSRLQGLLISVFLMLFGLLCLALVSPRSFYAGLMTLFLYNILYTYLWKKKWAFGAVPGAIPGALPPVIGYLAHDGARLSDPSLFYLFMVLFLWQMPHFWILAIKLKDDYKAGGVPVLPVLIGEERTRYHMALYLLAYVGLAASAPLFVIYSVAGSVIIWLTAFIVLMTFFRYLKNTKKWLVFFLSLNLSVLIFVLVPAVTTLKYYM
jgi:protoheme IX farnesyltransferase